MEISEAQYERIKDALPVQRGNVSLSNLQVLNAVLYVAEHGCKWRGFPCHAPVSTARLSNVNTLGFRKVYLIFSPVTVWQILRRRDPIQIETIPAFGGDKSS